MSLAILAAPLPIDISAAATSLAAATKQNTIDRAMQECKAAWSRAYELAKSKGMPAVKCQRMAAVAYKIAMPKMDSLTTIKAAVACVAQGIQLEVFDGRDGSQLLYAAQVAISIHREHQKGKSK